jgi:hypothetical protein
MASAAAARRRRRHRDLAPQGLATMAMMTTHGETGRGAVSSQLTLSISLTTTTTTKDWIFGGGECVCI